MNNNSNAFGWPPGSVRAAITFFLLVSIVGLTFFSMKSGIELPGEVRAFLIAGATLALQAYLHRPRNGEKK